MTSINNPQSLSDIKLRSAGPADIETILRHRREMFREMGGKYEQHLDQFEPGSRRYFEAALETGSYYGLFAEVADEIVAGGGILIADWPGSPSNFEPKRAWILNIYVEPNHRRKGLARTLAQSLIEWCRLSGFRAVSLHASEQGRGLYEKLGFTATSEMRLVL